MAPPKKIAFVGFFFVLLAAVVAVFGVFFGKWDVPSKYTVQIEAIAELEGGRVVLPKLPNIEGYTIEAAAALIPEVTKKAQVEISKLNKNNRFLSKSTVGLHSAERQRRPDALVILITKGTLTLDQLYERIDNDGYLEKSDDGYILKVPILIKRKATLILNGPGNVLKMQQETGAFIASRGQFFAINASILGWSGVNNAPAFYKSPEIFRPYLIFWDRSRTYIAGTRLAHLGFNEAKAYGLTYSTKKSVLTQDPTTPWPTGWLVYNVIEDLFYGMYSYEADSVIMVGNVMKDNIVYGFDPHDRSKNLIIARNEAFGTKIKHGIIISREVHHSWIFENVSYSNKGAGIMIDRNSHDNSVARNKVYNNGDGIVFYESGDNYSWGNKVYDNSLNGIRVRNSRNVVFRNETVLNNKGFGFDAYIANLDDQPTRDIVLDPYTQSVEVDIADSEFDQNGKGQIRFSGIDSMKVSNLKAYRIGKGFLEGDLKSESMKFYMPMTSVDSLVTIKSKSQTEVSSGIVSSFKNQISSALGRE